MAAGSALLLITGCQSATFMCESDQQCTGGICVQPGYCGFPDAACPSGNRYGDLAGMGLAGSCVPQGDSTGTGSSSGGSTAPVPTAGSSGSTGSGTLALTGTGTSATGSTSVTVTGSESSSDDSSSTTGPPGYVFLDDFERPDDQDIGNDWIEKTPDAFELLSGRVHRLGATTSFEDNVVYRPSDELVRDVEVSIELRYLDLSVGANPQIHARMQDGVALPDNVDGYLLYIPNSFSLSLVRLTGAVFTMDDTQPIPVPLELATDYRLTLRLVGESPVVARGSLEVRDGMGWTTLLEVGFDDNDVQAVTTAGVVGFSGHSETGAWTYDNFKASEIMQ